MNKIIVENPEIIKKSIAKNFICTYFIDGDLTPVDRGAATNSSSKIERAFPFIVRSVQIFDNKNTKRIATGSEVF